MDVINGSIICGRRGGSTLIDTVLPDSKTYNCPSGYVACSRNTVPSETICVPEDADKNELCPIIDLFLIREDRIKEVTRYGFEVTEGGIPLTVMRPSMNQTLGVNDADHEMTHIAYTRTMAPQWFTTSGAPFIGTTINNSVPPCYGPESNKLIIKTPGGLRFNIEKEETIDKCPSYGWSKMDIMNIRFETFA